MSVVAMVVGVPMVPTPSCPKGGEEVLGMRPIVAELFGVVPDQVPARDAQPTDPPQHLVAVHRLEVFFLRLVGDYAEAHRSFDDRHLSIAQADLVAGIDDRPEADGRGVGKVTRGNICSGSYRGVSDAGGVAGQRLEPAGGVSAAGGVGLERIAPAGGVAVSPCHLPGFSPGSPHEACPHRYDPQRLRPTRHTARRPWGEDSLEARRGPVKVSAAEPLRLQAAARVSAPLAASPLEHLSALRNANRTSPAQLRRL
jgi:hypothetical protein